jgi:hypothetical protein
MMKTETIQKYIANDGAEFYNEGKCLKYEAELRLVLAITDRLSSVNINHGEWYQHDRNTLREVKRSLFEIVVSKHGESFPEWKKWDAEDVHPCSVVGRVLDDSGRSPVAKAWCRLQRINFDNGREYDQPYYANNPHKAIKAASEVEEK